jgi:hypothetical protein
LKLQLLDSAFFLLFSGSLVMEELAKFPFLLSHNEQISFLVLEDERWNPKKIELLFIDHWLILLVVIYLMSEIDNI